MISYQHVCNTRQWRATTGLTQDQFTLLTTHFEETYRFLYGQTINELVQAIEVEFKLPTYADCVFFVLFQLKNGRSYDALGLLIQTDASNAQRNFDKHLHLRELTAPAARLRAAGGDAPAKLRLPS